MIRTEIRRVFRSKAFYAACAFMLAFMYYGISWEFRFLSGWGFICEGVWQEKFLDAAGYDGLVAFLCSLTVTLPYMLSYRKERDSGYRQLMVLKTSPGAYRRAKLLSVAVSGATVMSLPLLCWMPVCVLLDSGSINPGSVNPIYSTMIYHSRTIMSHLVEPYVQPLFESNINLFVFFYLVNISLAGAAFALLGLGVSAVIRSRYLSVLFPFGFCLFSAIVLDSYDKSLNAFMLPVLGLASWKNLYGLYGHILYLTLLLILGIGLFIGGDLYAEKA